MVRFSVICKFLTHMFYTPGSQRGVSVFMANSLGHIPILHTERTKDVSTVLRFKMGVWCLNPPFKPSIPLPLCGGERSLCRTVIHSNLTRTCQSWQVASTKFALNSLMMQNHSVKSLAQEYPDRDSYTCRHPYNSTLLWSEVRNEGSNQNERNIWYFIRIPISCWKSSSYSSWGPHKTWNNTEDRTM